MKDETLTSTLQCFQQEQDKLAAKNKVNRRQITVTGHGNSNSHSTILCIRDFNFYHLSAILRLRLCQL